MTGAPTKTKKQSQYEGVKILAPSQDKSRKHVHILATSFELELDRLVNNFVDEIKRHSKEEFLESSLDAMPRIIIAKAVCVSQQLKDREEKRRPIVVNGPTHLEEG